MIGGSYRFAKGLREPAATLLDDSHSERRTLLPHSLLPKHPIAAVSPQAREAQETKCPGQVSISFQFLRVSLANKGPFRFVTVSAVEMASSSLSRNGRETVTRIIWGERNGIVISKQTLSISL